MNHVRRMPLFAAVSCTLALLVAAPAAQAVQVFSNNVGWFRADADVFEDLAGTDAAENGDGVANWYDQSVSGFDVIQGTSGKQPTYVDSSLNGLPALSFSNAGGAGGTDGLTNAASNIVASGSDRTVLVAGQAAAANTGGTLFTFRRSGPVHTLSQMDLSGTYYVYSDGIAVNQTIANALAEVKSPFVTSYKGAIGSPLGVDLNGTVRPTSGGNLTNADTGLTGFTIGGRLDQPAGTYDFNGTISEVIVYDRRLNAAENIIAMNYLSSKYDTTLAANDRYAGDTPGNDDYDFEVFGVGQSAATASGSAAGNVTSGTAGTGLTIDADISTLGNGDFLLAGQQADANSYTSDDVLEDGQQRWSRAWYIDQTGSLDATLTFDFSDSGLVPLLGDSNYSLLFSSSDNFSFSVVDATAVINGDEISFTLTSAQLQDGFYTLAIQVPEPSTLASLLMGCVGLVWRTRRRTADRG